MNMMSLKPDPYLQEIVDGSKQFRLMDQSQLDQFRILKQNMSTRLSGDQLKLIARLHSELYDHPYVEPCRCHNKIWVKWLNQINAIYIRSK